MKAFLLIMAASLVGCSPFEREKNQPSTNDKYRIVQCFEKRADLVWTTPNRPVTDQYGFRFTLADGREVRISGDIIIQETK